MIKLYEEYNELPEIPENLKDRIYIDKFISNGDGTFIYDRNLFLSECDLTELPNLKITQVNGFFGCRGNKLTSLKYCPEIVKGDFVCADNRLTSLEYCPKIVEGEFTCSGNQLTSLDYCPKKVFKDFYCFTNLLLSIVNNCEMGKNFLPMTPLEKINDDEVLKAIGKMTDSQIRHQLEFFRQKDTKAYNLMREALDMLDIDYLKPEDIDQTGMF